MSIKVFNFRRRRMEVWSEKKCKNKRCGELFMGKPHETLCPPCEHKRMLARISETTMEDDWTKLPGGGHVRKAHTGSQDH